MICGETNQHRLFWKAFADELSHVDFTTLPHLSRPRIAQVRIVRPYNRFRLPASIKMRDQSLNCFHHVAVPQIPR